MQPNVWCRVATDPGLHRSLAQAARRLFAGIFTRRRRPGHPCTPEGDSPSVVGKPSDDLVRGAPAPRPRRPCASWPAKPMVSRAAEGLPVLTLISEGRKKLDLIHVVLHVQARAGKGGGDVLGQGADVPVPGSGPRARWLAASDGSPRHTPAPSPSRRLMVSRQL